jgi:hypothetical protein
LTDSVRRIRAPDLGRALDIKAGMRRRPVHIHLDLRSKAAVNGSRRGDIHDPKAGADDCGQLLSMG